VRSLVVVTKQCRPSKPGGGEPAEETVSRYVSSLAARSAEYFARLVRGHWGGCEIRNHWVRDALFDEDATRSRNLNLNGNLAVLRCALIAVKTRHAGHLSWPAVFELSGMKPALPYHLVCNHVLK
jgi:predicted transposase YbfD/YdcC